VKIQGRLAHPPRHQKAGIWGGPADTLRTNRQRRNDPEAHFLEYLFMVIGAHRRTGQGPERQRLLCYRKRQTVGWGILKQRVK
jgi:hypothetical protein